MEHTNQLCESVYNYIMGAIGARLRKRVWLVAKSRGIMAGNVLVMAIKVPENGYLLDPSGNNSLTLRCGDCDRIKSVHAGVTKR